MKDKSPFLALLAVNFLAEIIVLIAFGLTDLYAILCMALPLVFLGAYFSLKHKSRFLFLAAGLVCGILFWTNSHVTATYDWAHFSFISVLLVVFAGALMLSLPHTETNSVFGIRSPATLNHKEIWAKTHVYASVLYAITLIPQLMLIFYFHLLVKLVVGFLLATLPVLIAESYAQRLHKEYRQKEEWSEYRGA